MSKKSRKNKKTDSIGRSIFKFGKKISNGVTDSIKGRDIYGQPISLNYKGDDTFKTVPGGLLSMLLLFLIIAYAFLKGKYMVDKEEWSLI